MKLFLVILFGILKLVSCSPYGSVCNPDNDADEYNPGEIECAITTCGVWSEGHFEFKRNIELYDVISFDLQTEDVKSYIFAFQNSNDPAETEFVMKIDWYSSTVFINKVEFPGLSGANFGFPLANPHEFSGTWNVQMHVRPNEILFMRIDSGIRHDIPWGGNLLQTRLLYFHSVTSGPICSCVKLINWVHFCRTPEPTKSPSGQPTPSPTSSPSSSPSSSPTRYPSSSPTRYPSPSPTKAPIKQCINSCWEFELDVCDGDLRQSVQLCDSSQQTLPIEPKDHIMLQLSQANHMYALCDSICVYHIHHIFDIAYRWDAYGQCYIKVDHTDNDCYVINNDDAAQVDFRSKHGCSACKDLKQEIIVDELCSNSPHRTGFNKCHENGAYPDVYLYLAQANGYYPFCEAKCLFNWPNKEIYVFDDHNKCFHLAKNNNNDCYGDAAKSIIDGIESYICPASNHFFK